MAVAPAGAAPEARQYTIAAAVKTFQVLFAFRDVRGPCTLTEVARRARLPRNQVFRCLKSLEELGLVRGLPRGFILTPKLLELAPAIQEQSLLSAARPTLEALHRATGETVNLIAFIEDEDQTVCLATLATHHGVGLLTRVGQTCSLHAGAVPKAILSALPPEEQERVLDGLEAAARYTPSTARSQDALLRDLAETARRGYSISDEDFEEGARGVGGAILGPGGRPVGGLSVGGPVSRIDDAVLGRFGMLVAHGAREVSTRLGYSGGLAAATGTRGMR